MKGSALFFVVVALLAITGGGVVYVKARGIRNNNPGNIRHGSDWQGMSVSQTDNAFVQFENPVWGIRALNRVLRTYETRYGLNTVAKIISRWAPSNENDTTSYIESVSKALDVQPNQVIDVQARAVELSAAIIKHENGLQPYDLATLSLGVEKGWA